MPSIQQAKYRDQFIAAYERGAGNLRDTVTTETIVRAGSLYFLVVGSGGRSAVTRGSNGLIPVGDNTQAQTPVTLAPAYDKQIMNGFDIFTAQGDQLEAMRVEGGNVLGRAMDDLIITTAYTGTVTLGSVGTMSKTVANRISTILRNADVGAADRGNIFCLLSAAAFNYMEDITSFGNTQYSTGTGGRMQDGIPQAMQWKYWMGINWGQHNGVAGKGTSSCTCVAYHRASIGHAIGPGSLDAEIDKVPGEDASYCLHKAYHGSSKLQNSGIVKFVHDDSGLSA